MKIVLHRDTRRFFWSGLCWERCMEAFHFFWFQVSDFRMLNFEFFGTQIGGIGLILKISFTRLSPWAKSKANGNVLHRDARSFFEVDCVERNAWRNLIFFGFKFQVLLTRLSPWAESKANENSFTQRCTEFFWSGLCWEKCMEEFHFFWFQVSGFTDTIVTLSGVEG